MITNPAVLRLVWSSCLAGGIVISTYGATQARQYFFCYLYSIIVKQLYNLFCCF
jgi:hypothetical protein